MLDHAFNSVQHEVCTFSVDTTPVGKGRPRFTRYGSVYTPPSTVNGEKIVRYTARVAMQGRQPVDTPVSVVLEFSFEPPKSLSEKKRAELIGNPMTKKPDIDNLVKLVFDAMNGVVWVDDKQVSLLMTKKQYAEKSFISVKVYEYGE